YVLLKRRKNQLIELKILFVKHVILLKKHLNVATPCSNKVKQTKYKKLKNSSSYMGNGGTLLGK
ncbi:hypothetical protein C0J52_14618, partial [Blattella germanica]